MSKKKKAAGGEFEQPTLDEENNNGASVTLVDPIDLSGGADNTDATDELSEAVRASRAPAPVAVVPDAPPAPGKYKISYLLHGQRINESHVSVRKAVARVADLRRLGIVPQTSTDE